MAGTLVSFYKFNNDYNDNESAANNLAAAGTGNSFDSTNKKEGTHSLALNGSGYASKTSGISGITTGNADRTMGVWFRPTTASSAEAICTVGTVNTDQGFLILKLSATSIRVDLYADSVNFTVPSMSNNTFYHVHVEYTASGHTAKLYLNNTESSSGTLTFGANSNLVTSHIYAGLNDDGSLNFTGNLDLLKIYNGVTTAGERAADYNLATSYTQTLTETITVTETLSKTAARTLSETLTITETLVRAITRILKEDIFVKFVSFVRDDFDDNSIDAGKWNSWGGAQITEANRQLNLTTTTGAGYYGIDTQVTKDFTGGTCEIEVINSGNLSLTSYEFYPINLIKDANNGVFFLISGYDDTISAYKRVGGSNTSLANMAFNANTHRYLRIREAGGTTYWEYSADRLTWTALYSVANPIAVTALTAEAMVGTWDTEASTTVAIVDNFFLYGSSGDTLLKTPGKVLSEVFTITESLTRAMTHVMSETVTVTESLIRAVSRTLSETISITESLLKNPARIMSETITITESFVRSLGRTLSETITVTESLIKGISKIFSESITITETLTKLFDRFKKLGKFIGINDQPPDGATRDKDKPTLVGSRGGDKPTSS